MSAGRPSSYTLELAAEVCNRIASGLSLRKVCSDESMPCTATVMKWARDIPEFTEQYRAAREMLLEHWAEDILEISDDGSRDYVPAGDDEGVRVDHDHISRSKLRVDSRKWLLSKLAAKKYGDKIDHSVAGPDGGSISIKIIERTIVRPNPSAPDS